MEKKKKKITYKRESKRVIYLPTLKIRPKGVGKEEEERRGEKKID